MRFDYLRSEKRFDYKTRKPRGRDKFLRILDFPSTWYNIVGRVFHFALPYCDESCLNLCVRSLLDGSSFLFLEHSSPPSSLSLSFLSLSPLSLPPRSVPPHR